MVRDLASTAMSAGAVDEGVEQTGRCGVNERRWTNDPFASVPPSKELRLHCTVNPARFVGKDVTLSPLSRGQSAVLLDGLRIGRVSHVSDSQSGKDWLWCLTGPYCESAPPIAPMMGEARSLAEAKVQLKQSFDVWLGWALEQSAPVHWHWSEALAA